MAAYSSYPPYSSYPSFHPLSLAEASEIARQVPNVFQEGTALVVNEIGDGNLNLVFHIKDTKSSHGLILKQALPYAKVVGESWPLSLDRARIESEALRLMHSLCPEHVPVVYRHDSSLAFTMMEDLSDHLILRKGLIAGLQYPVFADHISTFLARTLFFTSDFGMDQQAKKDLVKQYINPDLCKITEDLIFADPYYDAATNHFEAAIRDAVEQLWQDQAVKLEVAILRAKFLTSAQALLHGDLHTGSIFVTEHTTKIIDPEFAYVGPMGFDIGAVLANLTLNYIGQDYWSKTAEACASFRLYLMNTISEIWSQFDCKFRSLWDEHNADPLAHVPGYQDLFMRQLLQDTLGFAGAKIIRRIIGLAHVADIAAIPDEPARERAERLALAVGRALLLQHRQASSIDELITILAQATEGVHIQ